MVCLSRPYNFKFFKGCLPQILLAPVLNTLTNMKLISRLMWSNGCIKYGKHWLSGKINITSCLSIIFKQQKYSNQKRLVFNFKIEKAIPCGHRTYIIHWRYDWMEIWDEDIQDVLWSSYVCLIYTICQGGWIRIKLKQHSELNLAPYYQFDNIICWFEFFSFFEYWALSYIN